MAKDKVCPKCGSADVIANVVAQPDGHGGQVVLWQGSRHSTISARVCPKCGYTELFAANPENLLPSDKK